MSFVFNRRARVPTSSGIPQRGRADISQRYATSTLQALWHWAYGSVIPIDATDKTPNGAITVLGSPTLVYGQAGAAIRATTSIDGLNIAASGRFASSAVTIFGMTQRVMTASENFPCILVQGGSGAGAWIHTGLTIVVASNGQDQAEDTSYAQDRIDTHPIPFVMVLGGASGTTGRQYVMTGDRQRGSPHWFTNRYNFVWSGTTPLRLFRNTDSWFNTYKNPIFFIGVDTSYWPVGKAQEFIDNPAGLWNTKESRIFLPANLTEPLYKGTKSIQQNIIGNRPQTQIYVGAKRLF